MQLLEKYSQDYLKKGFTSPVKIISEKEAKKHRNILESTEKVLGNMHYQSKLHTIIK